MIAKQALLLTELLSQSGILCNIPVYQRRYSWTEEHCQQLFNDLVEIVETGKKHFIGSIVYKSTTAVPSAQCLNIIDGQQRITSVMLFLKALHDLYDDEEAKFSIRHNFLLNAKANGKFTLKLKQVEADGSVFEKLIMYENFDENAFTLEDKGSNVYKNYIYFKKLIAQSNVNKNNLYEAVKKLDIISVSLEDEDPQKIFESMNSTGKTLTNTDLLRNYLLMDLPYDEQEFLYKKYWMQIEKNVGVSKIEAFMIHYLIMRKKSDSVTIHKGRNNLHINKETLYDAYKINFKPKDKNARELLEEMYKYSILYKRIVNNDNINGSRPDRAIYELIYELNAAPAAIFIMYLLSLQESENLSDEDILNAVQICISYVFRIRIFNGSTSNQFFGLAIQYYDKSTSKNFIGKVWDALNSGKGRYRFPNNKEFKDAFESKDILRPSKQPIIRYILYKYEKLKTKELVEAENVTIEHILPQNFDKWREHLEAIGDKDYTEYIHRIGNLTLTKDNSELSNSPFNDKKKIYKNSNYAITRELVNYKDWSSKEIKERSASMAAQALILWPLPENYNKNKALDPIDEMTNFMDDDTYELFNDLRDSVKNYDKSFTEILNQKYITFFRGEKGVLSLIPRQNYISVTLAAGKKQLTPNDELEDKSLKGHWGVGKSRFRVANPDDILQVLDYIRQMSDLNII